MKWLRNKLQAWLGVHDLEAENAALRNEIAMERTRNDQQRRIIEEHLNRMRKWTKVDVDVAGHRRGWNTVILTGVFRGQGFVRFYDVKAEEFEHLVLQLREMKRFAGLRVVDQPIGMKGGAFDLRRAFEEM